MSKQEKKSLGQYFTISEELQQFVFDKVKHRGSRLLEPSFGAGHLLKKFNEYDTEYPMVCYEIDATITPVIEFNKKYHTVIYGDFTNQSITEHFKTIIGNPPYIKQQKTGNLYIKFIELCFEYLDDAGGEMIFIVPSDFIKLTSAAGIIEKMTRAGSFTNFLFPNDEKLFEGASIDVLVFRYEKGLHSKTVNLNGKTVFCNVNKGIITFSDTEAESDAVAVSFDSQFHVYVGIVSGRDEIYRSPLGNIDVLTDKDRLERFIFTTTFPSKHPEIDKHLLKHKDELLERRIKKLSENNWFEWGAPRNIKNIHKYWGRPCIYIKNMTRHKDVAFAGTVQYFGGSLLCLVPKSSSHDEDGHTAAVIDTVEINRIVEYLNSDGFQKDYIYAGRFKIGHKQISTATMPTSPPTSPPSVA
jgi:adenine-specific DNA-methyltransferase